MTGCRVKSFTLKRTGQKIEIVPRKERTRVAQELVNNVFRLLNDHPDPKAYMLVVLDKDGRYSTDCEAKDFPFGYFAFASLVKDLITKDLLTKAEVRWFCKEQGWINS